jgi:hypothetical protein
VTAPAWRHPSYCLHHDRCEFLVNFFAICECISALFFFSCIPRQYGLSFLASHVNIRLQRVISRRGGVRVVAIRSLDAR